MMLCSGLLEDVDLERKVVRWRGEHDTTGFEHETIGAPNVRTNGPLTPRSST
jgi:hypothetical protein